MLCKEVLEWRTELRALHAKAGRRPLLPASLFAHSVPVYPYAVAASSHLASLVQNFTDFISNLNSPRGFRP
jgi:hypothetical protein